MEELNTSYSLVSDGYVESMNKKGKDFIYFWDIYKYKYILLNAIALEKRKGNLWLYL